MDFYRSETDQDIALNILIPILGAQTGDQVIGLVSISIDPEQYLYPFIMEWPSISGSAETLLVRREGNNVLFLNELRFQPDAALTLHFPLTNTELPAVKAILGKPGVVEGLDYRGQSVLADVRPVPDSPWFLVSKMDIAEVYAPLRERLREILGLISMAILVAGTGLVAVWRQQRIQYYRTQADAAETVRESEEQLKASQVVAGLGSYALDFSNSTWTSSDVLDEIFGIDKTFERSITGWADLIHPADRQQMTDYFTNDVIGKRTRFDKEYRIVRNNDQVERWVHGLGQLEFDAHNQLVKMLGTIQDITERKQAEESLRTSEERFRAIFEQAAVGVGLLETKTGRYVRINQTYCDFLGYTPAEMLQKGFQNVTYPEDVQANADHNAQLIIGQIRPYSLEKRYVRRDGTVVWGKLTVSPLWKPDETPDTYFHIAVVEDITERKQAEEALREANDYLENLFNYANAPIIVWDPQFKITRFNQAFEELTGKSAAEVLGKPLGILFPPAQIKASMKHIRKTLTGEHWEVVEIDIQHVDGSIHTVLWNSATLFSADGKTPMATIAQGQDITERKRAEQQLANYTEKLEEIVDQRARQLREAQEQLVRHERLATLGQLAGSIGHELRNPLGVISNAVYFLKMAQPDANDTIREYLDIIENETRTSDKIVTDLLDFTRIKSLDRQPVAVSELVRQTLERYPAPPSVELTLEIPPDLPPVYADAQHIIQVLGNLVVNAFQSMPGGGQLSLCTRTQNDMIAIVVQDTGLGISPENMKKLFEPLFTTKTKGIGLGLAVSRKLAEANGGRIEVLSEPGKGSTFTLVLPIHEVVLVPAWDKELK